MWVNWFIERVKFRVCEILKTWSIASLISMHDAELADDRNQVDLKIDPRLAWIFQNTRCSILPPCSILPRLTITLRFNQLKEYSFSCINGTKLNYFYYYLNQMFYITIKNNMPLPIDNSSCPWKMTLLTINYTVRQMLIIQAEMNQFPIIYIHTSQKIFPIVKTLGSFRKRLKTRDNKCLHPEMNN